MVSSMVKDNCPILPIDGNLTGIYILRQRGHGNNSNEDVFHILQIFRTGASPFDSCTKLSQLGLLNTS